MNVAEAVSRRPCGEGELAQAMLRTASHQTDAPITDNSAEAWSGVIVTHDGTVLTNNRRGAMAYVVIERAG